MTERSQEQAVDDGVSEAMIEAGLESYRRSHHGEGFPNDVRDIYLAMRALDPVLADMQEALQQCRRLASNMTGGDRAYFGKLQTIGEIANAALSRSERKGDDSAHPVSGDVEDLVKRLREGVLVLGEGPGMQPLIDIVTANQAMRKAAAMLEALARGEGM